MHSAETARRHARGEWDLVNELAALADLLHRGPAESRAACRAGVQWYPAGVLLEQLTADLTIVYSLQKVGGTTIAATLNAHPAVRPEALHLHYLSAKGLLDLQGQIDACEHPNVRYLWGHLAQCRGARALIAANRALRKGGAGLKVRKPFLIAGMRDPVALSLSLVFEGLSLNDQLGLLDDAFLRDWVMDAAVHHCDNWFADELGAMFGVDVFARPFPAERGWDIYENDEARVLLVRQENLDRLPDALGALYGLEPATFALNTCNVGENKEYAGHYHWAKRALRFTEAELDRVYGARIVRHFYTEEEIASFRRRWGADRPDTESLPTPKPTRKAKPEPATPGAPPHPWVCRPCPHCAQQLQSVPGLRHSCAGYAEYVQLLEGALRTAQQPAPPPPGLLRSLARRLPNPVRALARRLLPFGRTARR